MGLGPLFITIQIIYTKFLCRAQALIGKHGYEILKLVSFVQTISWKIITVLLHAIVA